MVKTILSPRAEDRRELFDEAAGIGRYKIQRHRAGLKLETAGTDLERLSDIISEVERTHGALKKQVASYRRYEKARNTIEQIRAALASGELLILEQRLAAARKALEQAAADEALHAGALSSLEMALAEARVRQGEAQTRLDEAHAKCASIESGIAALERERAVSAERVAGMRRTAGENMARCARERERALKYERDAEEAEAEAARWETRPVRQRRPHGVRRRPRPRARKPSAKPGKPFWKRGAGRGSVPIPSPNSETATSRRQGPTRRKDRGPGNSTRRYHRAGPMPRPSRLRSKPFPQNLPRPAASAG